MGKLKYITKIFSGLSKSLGQFSRHILFGRSPDVVFYYPDHFNRSAGGDNPFFKPLKELCRLNGIEYLCLEESAIDGRYPTDRSSIKADVLFWFVWLMHKVMTKGLGKSFHVSDKASGRLFDILTFGRFRAKTYITIANSMIDVLGEINPRGNVYDLQHGIIYRGHPGYFAEGGRLREPFLLRNRRVLLWGSLYKKTIVDHPHDFDVDDKFIVVGYPMYREIEVADSDKEKRIMVSLQFTGDIDADTSAGMMGMLEEFIEESVSQGYEVLMKHHPRFAGEVDMAPLLEKYAGRVSLTTRPLDELASEVKLHVTWGSTTTMEYAAYGVPTIFLRDRRFDWATDMFYGQYAYPLYDGMTAADVLTRAENPDAYGADCKTVKEWYESAYSKLDEALLLKILKGDINEK